MSLFSLLLSSSLAQAGDLDFLGWADVQAQHDSRADQPDYIDVAHVYLLVNANVHDHWSLFTEVELEHLPHLEGEGSMGELKMERAYLERSAPSWRLRAGKFNTPFGVRVPTHWLLLTPMLAKPIHEDNGYVPNKSVGVELHGHWSLGISELSATAFGSNGVENVGTNKPEDGLSGLGGDLSLNVASSYRLGVSAYRQARPDLGHVERSGVAYAELFLPANLLLRGEFTRHWQGSDAALSTWYVLGTYSVHRFDRLTVGYRFAQGADQRRAEGELHSIHSANLSLQVVDPVRLVLEQSLHHLEGQPDYQSTTLWVGVSF